MKAIIFLLGICLSAISVMGQLNQRKSQIGSTHFKMNRNLTSFEFQKIGEKVQEEGIDARLNKRSD